jgi:hypothetical protein
MSPFRLSPEQEQEAQQLATRAQEACAAEFLQMARTLVGKPTRELFGQSEFDLREIVLRVGAKMYEMHLAEKKTAMSAPALFVGTASKLPSSTATGPGRR